jgi:hypothetical protein
MLFLACKAVNDHCGYSLPFTHLYRFTQRLKGTHKVGPWTLTSNLYSVLSAVLKTGGNGCWLTTVAWWHMRYLPRRYSRRRHDRVSELCANPESRTVFCIVWYHHFYTPNAPAPSTHSSSPTFIMPTPTPSYIRNAMARIRPVCTWALKVLTEVVDEVLREAQLIAADSASR